MSFAKEPDFQHGQLPRTGLLIVNLGTPEAPTAKALRRYLGQFLMDGRVVEIPKAVWWLILNGIILRVRPRKSAQKYASIWMPQGSPLRVWTQKQADLLASELGQRGHDLRLRHAMRYGEPSVASQLEAFKAEGVTRLLVLPMYPQYSGATTASVMDEVFRWGLNTRLLPEMRHVNHFHDHPAYIEALAASVREHWARHGRPDTLVMSFHGMPHRTLLLGDPYHCECLKTGRLLAEALGLSKDEHVVTFQSRFGRAKWLQPYTEPTLRELARAGKGRVDVVCPAFVADCIETLEEIAMEGREVFLSNGGKDFHFIPCLNDRLDGIRALADVAEQHLQGWPTRPSQQPDAACLHARQARARALGAQA